MEGDDRSQGPGPHDRQPLKRSASESGLSSSDPRADQSASDTSNSTTDAPGVGSGQVPSFLSDTSLTGDILRILRQRANPPDQENAVQSAPQIAPQQRGQDLGRSNPEEGWVQYNRPRLWQPGRPSYWERGQHSGASNTAQGWGQNNRLWQPGASSSSFQRNYPTQNLGRVVIILDSDLARTGGVPQQSDPRLRGRLIAECCSFFLTEGSFATMKIRIAMGLQDVGGTIEYRSHSRFPGYWRLTDVTFEPDEDNEVDLMRLDIDHMSYEELLALGEQIGNVNTGLGKEVILSRMSKRKYTSPETGPREGEVTCCVCQEEYAAEDEIGRLDCGHEFHVDCIVGWLGQKNTCPICKKTALAARNPINPPQ